MQLHLWGDDVASFAQQGPHARDSWGDLIGALLQLLWPSMPSAEMSQCRGGLPGGEMMQLHLHSIALMQGCHAGRG